MSHYETIRLIVFEQLDVTMDQIVPEASFVEDFDVSLDFVELILACEQAFQITIPDEEAEQLDTVQKLTDYIDRKTKPDGTVWPPPPTVTP